VVYTVVLLYENLLKVGSLMFNTDPVRPIADTIKQQVYQIIKDKICKGEYSPGKWLQEKELANEFKVSRSPVREALRQLASDGLVVEIPHKGVFVKRITSKDIEDIFDVRVLLESYAIKKAYENLTEENKNALMDYVSKLTQAHEEGNLHLYIELDTKLHNLIIDMSGNSVLKTTYEKVHSMIQQFRIYSLTGKQRFDESVVEHQDIVNGIISGNVDEADQINKTHLRLAKEKIQEYITRLESTHQDLEKVIVHNT